MSTLQEKWDDLSPEEQQYWLELDAAFGGKPRVRAKLTEQGFEVHISAPRPRKKEHKP